MAQGTGWVARQSGPPPPKVQQQSPKTTMGMGTQPQLICQGATRLVAPGAGSCMDPCTVVGQGEEEIGQAE